MFHLGSVAWRAPRSVQPSPNSTLARACLSAGESARRVCVRVCVCVWMWCKASKTGIGRNARKARHGCAHTNTTAVHTNTNGDLADLVQHCCCDPALDRHVPAIGAEGCDTSCCCRRYCRRCCCCFCCAQDTGTGIDEQEGLEPKPGQQDA